MQLKYKARRTPPYVTAKSRDHQIPPEFWLSAQVLISLRQFTPIFFSGCYETLSQENFHLKFTTTFPVLKQ